MKENKDGKEGRRDSSSIRDDLAAVGDSRIGLVEDKQETTEERPKACWGARHTMAFIGFLGATCVYAMRVNLSVAIVAMVKSDAKNATNSSDLNQVCLPPEDYDPSEDGNENGEFDWNEVTQGLILSSFFYGYTVTNLLGGRAAEILGGKLVFGSGVVITAIFTLISPICAKVSTGLFITVRVLVGASQGIVFPAMNSMLAKWIPPVERARFSTLVYAGANIGTVVAMPVSGWLCDTDFLGGWPSVFYVFGALGVLWGLAWFLLVSNHPEDHPRISKEEKAYIIEHCGSKNEKALPIPWKAVFTSLPFWAILIADVGNSWGFYTLLTELPTYLKNIQHFDMTSNGLLSALPYLVLSVFSFVYSNTLNYPQASGKISIITVRRISMIIGIYGPMLALIAMCFVDCNQVLAMVFLCLAVGLNGAVYSGYLCSHQDLAPNLAGTLMGFTSTAANITGFIAPSVTGLITNDNQTLSAWRTVFLISAAMYLVVCTFHLIFISADVQPWNFEKEKDGKDESKKQTKS